MSLLLNKSALQIQSHRCLIFQQERVKELNFVISLKAFKLKDFMSVSRAKQKKFKTLLVFVGRDFLFSKNESALRVAAFLQHWNYLFYSADLFPQNLET